MKLNNVGKFIDQGMHDRLSISDLRRDSVTMVTPPPSFSICPVQVRKPGECNNTCIVEGKILVLTSALSVHL